MSCPMRQQNLELKVVPIGVFVVCTVLMFALSYLLPSFAYVSTLRYVSVVLCIAIGATFLLVAYFTFEKAQTTKSPVTPEATAHLVTTGIYKLSRNPMYLGGAFMTAAMALLASNYIAFIFVAVFIAYITQFQIKPEERILKSKFPEEFEAYAQQTRRWI